jgi:hypothetical protein
MASVSSGSDSEGAANLNALEVLATAAVGAERVILRESAQECQPWSRCCQALAH